MLLADRGRQRPVEQVAHVGKNLHGHAARTSETCKLIRGAFKRPRRPVGKAGEQMPQ